MSCLRIAVVVLSIMVIGAGAVLCTIGAGHVFAQSRPADSGPGPMTAETSSYANGSFLSLTNISISDLVVNPEDINVWWRSEHKVTVSVLATNNGISTETRTLNISVNNSPGKSKSVTLEPEASETVTFTIEKKDPGVYNVHVGEVGEIPGGEFTIRDHANAFNGVIGGIEVCLIVTALVIFVRRSRAIS
ncbi:hypothetical protein ACFLXE_02525 [Chloroflexota bacterium]